MRVAALDLGSNTFLLLIAEVKDREVVEVYHDEVKIVRLGQGVHASRRFHPEALKRADDCLCHFREVINQYGVEKVVAVATSAARDVGNKEELFKIAEKYEIPLHIISGDLEAKLTFLGSGGGSTSHSEYAVIDVGGGSTEVIGRNSGGDITGCSIDVGSVRLKEMFVTGDPPKEEELEKLQAYILQQTKEKKDQLPKPKEIIAVAGTPTSLAAIEQKISFDPQKIDGYILSVEGMNKLISKMGKMSLQDRQGLVGLEQDRADVIIPGTCILKTVTEFLGKDKVTVSTRGVRYGLAANWQDLKSK